MRNRWFHRSVLHVDGVEKKVSWLELFYDLIFVAAIIQLGDALSHEVTETHHVLEPVLRFSMLYIPLWFNWTGFTFFMNRFTLDDVTHRITVFVMMSLMGVMAVAAPTAFEGQGAAIFSGAAGGAMVMVAFMYHRSKTHVPDARDYSVYWGRRFLAAGVLWIGTAFVGLNWMGWTLWAVGLAVIFSAPVSKVARSLADRYPIDFEHLSERYGLMIIIVLGESFVKVLSYLTQSDHGTELSNIIKGCMGLFVTCTLWWIYFDDVAGAHLKKQRGAFVVWLYGHLPLAIGMTGVGVAVKKVIGFDMSQPAPDEYRWLLTGMLSLAIISVAVIDSVTLRREAHLSDRTRVNVRIICALVILLLGQAGAGMSAELFMWMVIGVCLTQVIFDLAIAPFAEAEHEEADAMKLAELVRRRQDGTSEESDESQKATLDITATVRKGAPAELRRDMYFYFLEGGWGRVFLAFGVLFVMINIIFASLYMLEPGCISNSSSSFADAFAFSVQTFATIGYGTMSPATSFGHLIVTFEAIASILAIAFSTGLVFAKASRPHSSVLFSDVALIHRVNGVPHLVLRVGNARGNEVLEASMSVSAIVDEVTLEGEHMRRLVDLKLQRASTPLFVLTWTATHAIDENSPLYGIALDKIPRHLVSLVVTLMGHDGTYGQTIHARKTYSPADVRPGHRFVDVIHTLPDGRLMIDYGDFHKTTPVDEFDPRADAGPKGPNAIAGMAAGSRAPVPDSDQPPIYGPSDDGE